MVCKEFIMIPHDLVDEHVLEVDQESVEADVLVCCLVEVIVEHHRPVSLCACERLHVVPQQVRFPTLRGTRHEHDIARVDVRRVDVLEGKHELLNGPVVCTILDERPRILLS